MASEVIVKEKRNGWCQFLEEMIVTRTFNNIQFN
jgi:hypothetical protein